jgi:hypothetical protein
MLTVVADLIQKMFGHISPPPPKRHKLREEEE